MLKVYAGFNLGVSCKDMTADELNELIVWSFAFGENIGLKLNFRNNEYENLYN
jgi:hypothetical protein